MAGFAGLAGNGREIGADDRTLGGIGAGRVDRREAGAIGAAAVIAVAVVVAAGGEGEPADDGAGGHQMGADLAQLSLLPETLPEVADVIAAGDATARRSEEDASHVEIGRAPWRERGCQDG